MQGGTSKPLWPLGELEVEVCQEKPKSRNKISARWFLLSVSVLLLLPGVSNAQKSGKLYKPYREWLEQDVVYIITREERRAFLRLPSDTARDKFIEDFLEIRNPTPRAPSNS